MAPDSLHVLYEDNHLLVVNKPAGVATQGALPGRGSLVELAKQYLKDRYHKPGNVYLGVVSRLDSRVTGVVVLARTSKAAARLNEQFAHSAVEKVYWAVVERPPQPPAAECHDWLAHDDRQQRMRVTSAGAEGAKEARLQYTTRRAVATGWLLEILLATGRKHQIRVQLASRGWPIVGDRKYGSVCSWPEGIALHARQLTIQHPIGGRPLVVVAPLPATWQAAGITE